MDRHEIPSAGFSVEVEVADQVRGAGRRWKDHGIRLGDLLARLRWRPATIPVTLELDACSIITDCHLGTNITASEGDASPCVNDML